MPFGSWPVLVRLSARAPRRGAMTRVPLSVGSGWRQCPGDRGDLPTERRDRLTHRCHHGLVPLSCGVSVEARLPADDDLFALAARNGPIRYQGACPADLPQEMRHLNGN